eukprot:CAMPEP_0114563908 /NCGR_PEP_ID=MMETSP0114-20121206/13396_1 /TAXON_ID=31324 /ORGANISM="Goniomonas sp, Strain m" /LENGTH=175 /DNA_ID=CAMNT_0001749857 /DNA_START=9 /DNA_END=533 /DNA_ORIENTATION=-
MALAFIAKNIAPLVGACLGEAYLARSFGKLVEPTMLQVPKLYGGVVLVNAVGTSFLLIYLSTKVGQARAKFIEKAKKDGDADAEARYAYPKMFAEGFSDTARQFNCIQRGHQHALETYPSFIVLSLVGGLRFPVVTMLGGLVWMIARVKWAQGYATGNPSERYSSPWGKHIWTSI